MSTGLKRLAVSEAVGAWRGVPARILQGAGTLRTHAQRLQEAGGVRRGGGVKGGPGKEFAGCGAPKNV